MTERPEDEVQQPLPTTWLPDPHPPDDDRRWNETTERIMRAAAPELQALRSRRSTIAVGGWSEMGRWWKPAAVLAAASIALLLLLEPLISRTAVPRSLPLGFVASDGDPVTLWRMMGLEADPVLALIAIRDQTSPRQAPPEMIRDEENR